LRARERKRHIEFFQVIHLVWVWCVCVEKIVYTEYLLKTQNISLCPWLPENIPSSLRVLVRARICERVFCWFYCCFPFFVLVCLFCHIFSFSMYTRCTNVCLKIWPSVDFSSLCQLETLERQLLNSSVSHWMRSVFAHKSFSSLSLFAIASIMRNCSDTEKQE